jgi:hypothetical protein
MYNPATFAMEKHTEKATHLDTSHSVSANRMGWVLQLALEETLGQSGGNTALNLTDHPDNTFIYQPYDEDPNSPLIHISHLQAGLESAYGPRAGRGLSLRVGRACFKYGLREFGTELVLTDLAFRLLPFQTKLKTGTDAFAALFNTYTDQIVRLERDERYIYWLMERCPLCWERQSEGPCCHLALGFLQEALFWASGGKHLDVEEKQSIADVDGTCTIQIDRIPMS